jgi:hypothetical protein
MGGEELDAGRGRAEAIVERWPAAVEQVVAPTPFGDREKELHDVSHPGGVAEGGQHRHSGASKVHFAVVSASEESCVLEDV